MKSALCFTSGPEVRSPVALLTLEAGSQDASPARSTPICKRSGVRALNTVLCLKERRDEAK